VNRTTTFNRVEIFARIFNLDSVKEKQISENRCLKCDDKNHLIRNCSTSRVNLSIKKITSEEVDENDFLHQKKE
jgi:hypothetical protein